MCVIFSRFVNRGAPKEAVLAMECIISIIITLGAHQLDEDEFEVSTFSRGCAL